jgi:hypothetical protein
LSLHLEVLVAFGAAEAEHFGIVADEGDAFGRVDGARAEMTRLDPISISYYPIVLEWRGTSWWWFAVRGMPTQAGCGADVYKAEIHRHSCCTAALPQHKTAFVCSAFCNASGWGGSGSQKIISIVEILA